MKNTLRRKKTRPTDRLAFYQATGKHGRQEQIDSPAWLKIWFDERPFAERLLIWADSQ